ncbi:MAG: UDP-glucose 4-epimerase (EC [uncultured Paraburkholderia sp.]|uniref:NAD-dependent epimerase/dehydratase family protein n=1 Tax=uncultured Paraburkholderia sp. TaxID=1822466 RepID=UPI0025970CEC|nr:NAD(P)-dependent oxidoreductase [uncultured Paraburkholderia sp.]CAH2904437.1 MAG: UDP-glucose 4-epimerase (EC [uncultured Paraburkholderia sp.]CAH2943751.1 MAG: UDP-glucose 4-epimerase (EC [uncultured Paraburkholderia sp.]
MTAVKRVLVTGSTGNLGAKAVSALRGCGSLDVVGIGRNSSGDPSVITADMELYDHSWAQHFEGADAVLHLAADPKPVGSWDSITRLNVELALNVFRAAEEARVRRFVFASSNWVLGGYRLGTERLTSVLSPRPVNPYGASKLFIERYGMAAARNGMSVISLRIGYCQPGENMPGAHMAFGRWGQEMWLGNDDWAQAVIRSVASPYQGSAILNIVSRNEGSRWDLEEAKETIGYDPVQTHQPVTTIRNYMKDRCAALRERLIPMGTSVPPFGARW